MMIFLNKRVIFYCKFVLIGVCLSGTEAAVSCLKVTAAYHLIDSHVQMF